MRPLQTFPRKRGQLFLTSGEVIPQIGAALRRKFKVPAFGTFREFPLTKELLEYLGECMGAFLDPTAVQSEDQPYALRDGEKRDGQAAAWLLSDLKLGLGLGWSIGRGSYAKSVSLRISVQPSASDASGHACEMADRKLAQCLMAYAAGTLPEVCDKLRDYHVSSVSFRRLGLENLYHIDELFSREMLGNMRSRKLSKFMVNVALDDELGTFNPSPRPGSHHPAIAHPYHYVPEATKDRVLRMWGRDWGKLTAGLDMRREVSRVKVTSL